MAHSRCSIKGGWTFSSNRYLQVFTGLSSPSVGRCTAAHRARRPGQGVFLPLPHPPHPTRVTLLAEDPGLTLAVRKPGECPHPPGGPQGLSGELAVPFPKAKPPEGSRSSSPPPPSQSPSCPSSPVRASASCEPSESPHKGPALHRGSRRGRGSSWCTCCPAPSPVCVSNQPSRNRLSEPTWVCSGKY